MNNIRCIQLQLPPQITLISLHLHKTPKLTPRILKPLSLTIPPTDITINFGKYKGKMLGTLPSNYLKWVSKTLITQDSQHWSKLADQVLQHPLYKDRIEWEFFDRVRSGEASSHTDAASLLLELSERFGWDYDDETGWSKIDFDLLGTSKGGRIPRVGERKEIQVKEVKIKKSQSRVLSEGRQRRLERMKARSRVSGSEQPLKISDSEDKSEDDDIEDDRTVEIRSRFPGRHSLIEKALNRRMK